MFFVFAALADFILFVLHVAAIFIGEPAYLFLRAGKVMAEADARGETWPAILTGAISTVFWHGRLFLFGRVRTNHSRVGRAI